MKNRAIYLLSAFWCLSTVVGNGQSQDRKTILQLTAEQKFKKRQYPVATMYFEKLILSENPKEKAMRKENLRRLVTCYRAMNDQVNAQKVLEMLIGEGETGAEYYLYYAQALAFNKNWNEAALYFRKYSENSSSPLGQDFAKAYADFNSFVKDSSQYTINLSNLNSPQDDFSPVFYKNGIVFTSSRITDKTLKNIYPLNNTAYLDMYRVKDSSTIVRLDSIQEQAIYKRYKAAKMDEVDNDDYTVLTSNDTKTLGFHYNFNKLKKIYADSIPDAQVINYSRRLNTKYHDGPSTFFPSGDTCILTRNNYNKGIAGKDKSEGLNKLKLYIAYRNGEDGWSAAEELPYNGKTYSTGHPTLSPNGRILIFASDRKGGFGGTDLYMATFDGKNWGEPINLGSKVNSSQNEMFPYYAGDSLLYFASNGHPGLGGLDLFKIDLGKDEKPKNMGYPLNTQSDDFGLCTKDKGKSGLFSSNRMGLNDDNIYFFTYTEPHNYYVKISVADAETKAVLPNAEIAIRGDSLFGLVSTTSGSSAAVIYKINHGDSLIVKGSYSLYFDSTATQKLTSFVRDTAHITVYLRKVKGIPFDTYVFDHESLNPIYRSLVYVYNTESNRTDTLRSTGNGRIFFMMEPGHHYLIKATKESYFSDCISVVAPQNPSKDTLSSVRYLYLERLKLSATIQVENLLYDLDKYFIRPDAAHVLDNLAKYLKQYPNLRIELGSHTDSRGSDAYNLKLSDNRAKSAVEYLINKQNINARGIRHRGYGETRLVNKCKNGVKCSESEHQANRRTEVKIVEFINPEFYDLRYPDEATRQKMLYFDPAQDQENCHPTEVINPGGKRGKPRKS